MKTEKETTLTEQQESLALEFPWELAQWHTNGEMPKNTGSLLQQRLCLQRKRLEALGLSEEVELSSLTLCTRQEEQSFSRPKSDTRPSAEITRAKYEQSFDRVCRYRKNGRTVYRKKDKVTICMELLREKISGQKEKLTIDEYSIRKNNVDFEEGRAGIYHWIFKISGGLMIFFTLMALVLERDMFDLILAGLFLVIVACLLIVAVNIVFFMLNLGAAAKLLLFFARSGGTKKQVEEKLADCGESLDYDALETVALTLVQPEIYRQKAFSDVIDVMYRNRYKVLSAVQTGENQEIALELYLVFTCCNGRRIHRKKEQVQLVLQHTGTMENTENSPVAARNNWTLESLARQKQ